MTEDSKSNTMSLIIASIIGGLIVYFILKQSNNLPQSYSTMKPINQPKQLQVQQSQQLQQPVQILENDENWEFKKDEKGRIIGVNVHRKLFDNVKFK